MEPVPTPGDPDPLAEAEHLATARNRLCDRVLSRLAQPITEKEKASHVRALGKLGTPKAIDYLFANHDFTIFPEHDGLAGFLPLCEYPCMEALNEIGMAAVPRAVEAFITLPANRWPVGFCDHFLFMQDRTRARVAYIYAQGYLFAMKENGHHRDAALDLIQSAAPLVFGGDVPFPPPWMGPPEK